MAHAAIGELLGVNLVFGDESFAERELIGRGPIQIENFIARANEFFRRAMAFETPFHVKCVRLPCERHLIELAMTRRAADALADVDAVVKKNKIRRVIDAIPAQRCSASETFAHGPSIGASFQICEWQVMQVSVDGMPAKADFSTVVWQ